MPNIRAKVPSKSAPGVVGYVRVSTQGQAVEGVSLDDQANAIARWARERGFALLRVFREAGKSGRTTEGRAALREALQFCAANIGRVGALVVYDLSRFARDAGDQIRVREQLRRVGIRLTSVVLDLHDDAHGGLVSGILADVNEFASRLSGEKIRSCMAEVARRGGWPWQAPLGYRNGRDGAGGKTVEIDSEMGPLLRYGFELVAEGVGPTAALRKLAALGLRSRRGRSLYPKEFRAILKHPFYAGRVTSVDFGVDVEGRHAALVDRETWQRVQDRLTRRGRDSAPAANDQAYPLRGIVVCEACGRRLTASASRGKAGKLFAYYHCWRDCEASLRLPAARLEQDFASELARVQIHPDLWALIEAHLVEMLSAEQAEQASIETTFRRRRQDLQTRRERLVETYLAGDLDEITYRRLLKRSAADLQAVDLEHRRHADLPADLTDLLAYAKRVATELCDLWTSLPKPGRQRLATLVFPEGVLVSKSGLRTPQTAFPFNDFRHVSCNQGGMVEQKGFEPSTPTLRTWCSPS